MVGSSGTLPRYSSSDVLKISTLDELMARISFGNMLKIRTPFTASEDCLAFCTVVGHSLFDDFSTESQTGAGKLKTLKSWKLWKLENFENIKNDPWDMLNNFCFHVYAQKLLFKVENVNAF